MVKDIRNLSTFVYIYGGWDEMQEKLTQKFHILPPAIINVVISLVNDPWYTLFFVTWGGGLIMRFAFSDLGLFLFEILKVVLFSRS
jgi:hypothetical protein